MRALLVALALHTTLVSAQENSGYTRWQVAGLYVATLGYAMDANGLEYWVRQIDDGVLTLNQVAQSFFEQPLVMQSYPPELSKTEFINALYLNIFGYPANPDEQLRWVTVLNDTPRGTVVLLLINDGYLNSTVQMQRFQYRIQAALLFAKRQWDLSINYNLLSEAGHQCLIDSGKQLLADITNDVTTYYVAVEHIDYLLSVLVDW